jgi:hypothetical protein
MLTSPVRWKPQAQRFVYTICSRPPARSAEHDGHGLASTSLFDARDSGDLAAVRQWRADNGLK